MTQAISTLLSDGALRVAMGRNGQRLVMGKYSWGGIAASMAELYRGLIASRQGLSGSG